MRSALLTTALYLALLSLGCLYSEPLLPGKTEPVDPNVLGEWRCVAPESSHSAILHVSEVPNQQYRAEFVDGDDKAVFSVFAVRLKQRPLLNVQELVHGSPGKWTLARYTLFRPTVLHLEFAREEPFKEAVTSAQRTAILQASSADTLFEDYCTCIRIHLQ